MNNQACSWQYDFSSQTVCSLLSQRVALLVLWLCLEGVGAASPLTLQSSGLSTPIPPAAVGQQLSLSGWFHVIWNGEAQYRLIDDQGRWTELLLDEHLVRPFGGPRAFNRKRVKIVGEKASTPPEAIRVLSIELE
jgi:hypothetical protein